MCRAGGDASIFVTDAPSTVTPRAKRPRLDDEQGDPSASKPSEHGAGQDSREQAGEQQDIQRTGGKCVPGGPQDSV